MKRHFLKAGALAAAILVSVAGGAQAQAVQGILWEGPTAPYNGITTVPPAVLAYPPAAVVVNQPYWVEAEHCHRSYGHEHCLFVPRGVAVPQSVAPGVAIILGR